MSWFGKAGVGLYRTHGQRTLFAAAVRLDVSGSRCLPAGARGDNSLIGSPASAKGAGEPSTIVSTGRRRRAATCGRQLNRMPISPDDVIGPICSWLRRARLPRLPSRSPPTFPKYAGPQPGQHEIMGLS